MDALRIREPPPAPPTGPAPKRILVVDDLPGICTIFKDLHRRIRGVETQMVTETNSQKALELIARERFDLVISDYRMREVDGIEVLKQARAANPAGYRVLMTGYNEIPTGVARIREASVDAYVQKPLHAQELLLLILGLLQDDARVVDEHRRDARELENQADVGTVAFG